MKILADIGGTYARFAVSDGGAIKLYKKYKAMDFKTLADSLSAYCKESGCGKGGIAVATAAYPDTDGSWRFVNQNSWIIDPQVLKAAGWAVEMILNDFEASVWGLKDLKAEDLDILKPGATGKDFPSCLIGPGTGLGLGYLVHGRVQKTHGGHMLAAGATQEHHVIIQALAKNSDKPVVFENLVSGPGLVNLYKVQCLIAGDTPDIERSEEIFYRLDDQKVQNALRLFHEFFGLFAQTVVISLHAYGGLYLTGGVLDRLVEGGVFDFAHFKNFFTLGGVDSVKKDLDKTPVAYVKDPHLALRGLLVYSRDQVHG